MKSLYFLSVVAIGSMAAFAACSSSDTTPAATGGSAGAATGGTAGAAGTANGGSAGTANGGSAGAATGGTAGEANGGAAGEAGAAGAAGAAGGDAGSCKKCAIMVATADGDLTHACVDSMGVLEAVLACTCLPENCGGAGKACEVACSGDAGTIDQACQDCDKTLMGADGGACYTQFMACLADK